MVPAVARLAPRPAAIVAVIGSDERQHLVGDGRPARHGAAGFVLPGWHVGSAAIVAMSLLEACGQALVPLADDFHDVGAGDTIVGEKPREDPFEELAGHEPSRIKARILMLVPLLFVLVLVVLELLPVELVGAC